MTSTHDGRRVAGAGHRTAGDALLAVDDLAVEFRTSAGPVRAVNGVSLALAAGETVGLVGESGSGKSVTSRAIMGLLPPKTSTTRGSIRLDGEELVGIGEKRYRKIRGERIAMVFQDPLTALNPLYRAGEQVAEALRFHFGMAQGEALKRARDLFVDVGLPDPDSVVQKYPHELSGGMRQRVMIAMALACEPELLIADEPTTALDVTIQAQILDLMRELQADFGMGVVAEMAERVAVMYAGQIVEEADTPALFADPMHPYTRGLIGSVPVIGRRQHELAVIPGRVPNLINLPPGCRFAPRCEARIQAGLTQCTVDMPALVEVGPGRKVRCFLHSDEVQVDVPVVLTKKQAG